MNMCGCGYSFDGVTKPQSDEPRDKAAEAMPHNEEAELTTVPGPDSISSTGSLIKRYLSRISLYGLVMMALFGAAGFVASVFTAFITGLFVHGGGINFQGDYSQYAMRDVIADAAAAFTFLIVFFSFASFGLTCGVSDGECKRRSFEMLPIKILYFTTGVFAGFVLSCIASGYFLHTGVFSERSSSNSVAYISFIFSIPAGLAGRILFFMKYDA